MAAHRRGEPETNGNAMSTLRSVRRQADRFEDTARALGAAGLTAATALPGASLVIGTSPRLDLAGRVVFMDELMVAHPSLSRAINSGEEQHMSNEPARTITLAPAGPAVGPFEGGPR